MRSCVFSLFVRRNSAPFQATRSCLFSIFVRIDIAQLFHPVLHIHPLSYLARRGGRVAEGARLEGAAVGVCLSFHLENRQTDGLAQSPQVGGWWRPPGFPCSSKRIPCFCSQGIGCYSRGKAREFRLSFRQESQITEKFPEFSLLIREMASETSSLQTDSTAI